MSPLVDKNSLELLIEEEKNFIICAYEGKELPAIFKDVSRRYSHRVLVLSCAFDECPQPYRCVISGHSFTLLLFCSGKWIDALYSSECRENIHRRIEGFVRFVQVIDSLLLRESLFQRSKKKAQFSIRNALFRNGRFT